MRQVTGTKSSSYDVLSGISEQESPLYASLHGARKSLMANLGLSALPIVQHDNFKHILKREGKSHYPYAYLKMTSLRLNKDRQNLKTIKRRGHGIQAEMGTAITIYKGYLFPASLSMELNFTSDSFDEILTFTEKLAILAATDSFSFTLKMPDMNDWVVTLKFESDDFSIPQVSIEDESNPSAAELNIPFTIDTNIGIIKQVAKFNNDNIITTNVDTERDDT